MDVVKDDSGLWLGYVDRIVTPRIAGGRWAGRAVYDVSWRALPHGFKSSDHSTKRAAVAAVRQARMSNRLPEEG